MSPVAIALLISGTSLILGVIYQAWARANSEGKSSQVLLGLQGNVAKLLDCNVDREKFQAGMVEYVGTQKVWNARTDDRLGNVEREQNQARGREDGRNRER